MPLQIHVAGAQERGPGAIAVSVDCLSSHVRRSMPARSNPRKALMRKSARRIRKERERVEELRYARFEWVTEWFAALPHDALLVIKENGIVIGKVHKFDVTWGTRRTCTCFCGTTRSMGLGTTGSPRVMTGRFGGNTYG